MEIFLELVKITLPWLVALAAAYIVMVGFFRYSEKRQKQKTIQEYQKLITPLRLQAYERLVMLMERISPEALVMRPDMFARTSEQLHSQLLQTLRAEFDHNLSQQLYVSEEAWKKVRQAKNNSITLISNAARGMESNTPALELSHKILDMTVLLEQSVTDKAISELKREFQQLF